MALSVSSTRLLVSAMRSWAPRDSRRTRRPITISGTITTGISARIQIVSRALVSASMMTSAPIRLSTERRVIDRLTPAMAWTSVVSAVSRDSTSPVRVTSKNVGSMRTTRRYTASRRSATTRSPSQVTR
jgi:hypothetical protein